MKNKVFTHIIYLLLLAFSVNIIFQLNNKSPEIIKQVDTLYVEKIVNVQITDTVYAEIVTFESDSFAVAVGTVIDSFSQSTVNYKLTYDFNKERFFTDFDFSIPVSEKTIIKTVLKSDDKINVALLSGVHGNTEGYEVTLGVGLMYKRVGLFVSGNTNKTIGLSFIYVL
jgi:hypothetical protein